MKTLSLHCDYIKFKPLKKAVKSIKDVSEKEKEEIHVKDVLVIMISIEKNDNEKSVSELIKNIKDVSEKVKTENIVLYPYAHLSSDLASPEIAVKILNETEKFLKSEKTFNVSKAPFGYYKELELKVKGHPLAELSREIIAEQKEEIDENDLKELVRKISKVKMSAPKGQNGLKSNVELGRDLDLYIVNEIIGQGLPLLTPKGTAIKREIERFVTDEELKRGYLHTSTPVMAKSDLYKVSGHWQHYRDDMFILDIGGEKFALRPMTCPFQFVLYKRKPRSYKDLPLRYAEISTLFRNEKSGELRGLTRIRQFTLSDAHIICRPEQLEEEFEKVIDLIKYAMKKLGIKNIWYRFSRRDEKDKEKYIGDSEGWRKSEETMEKILKRLKINYVEAKGEAAFYGPKLDLQFKDVYGKEDTLFTVQIDFALPEKYDMNYKDKDNELKRPIIIHRASIGCVERTIAQLLEQTQGNLPVWLSPIQVKVISFTDKNIEAAKKFLEKLKEQNIRVEEDFYSTTVNEKVRNAELQKIPYIVTIGNREETSNTIAIRKRGDKKINSEKPEDFIKNLRHEIKERT